MMTRTILLAGAAVFSLHSTALAQSPATGSPAARDDQATVGEVLLTARRREESLQDVPIAVSAFSVSRSEANDTRESSNWACSWVARLSAAASFSSDASNRSRN